MSITFWCPEAPTTKVTPYPDQDPDFVVDKSVLPEINLANSNAISISRLMKLGDPEYPWAGTCSAEEVPAALEQVTRLMADSAIEGASQRSGLPPDYLARTLARMKELFEAARDHKYSVSWG